MLEYHYDQKTVKINDTINTFLHIWQSKKINLNCDIWNKYNVF